jgi:hypothetical protein
MIGNKHRCCAKTLKGTRCKLSNSFTGEFCHIHCPKVAEPVPEVPEEQEIPEEPEREHGLEVNPTVVDRFPLRIDIFPKMDSGMWVIVRESVDEDAKTFRDALDWVAADQLGASDQTVEFWFDKCFPRVGSAMKYDGQEGMKVIFHKPTKQLMVKIDFTQ